MAEHDTGGGFNFGQAALGVLAGAAAGSQSGSIGGGFLQGLQTAQGLQDRRQRQAQTEQQQQRQLAQDEQRTRAADLSAQRQQQVIDKSQKQTDLSDFNIETSLYQNLGKESQLKFQQEYAMNAIRPRDTDGTLTYGFDEGRAIEIDHQSRASESIANSQTYINALLRSIEPRNENERVQAERMQRVLGSQLGFNYIPESNGIPAQIQTPYGAFPAELESGQKIMDRVTEDAFARRKKYETGQRLKSEAASGAERTIMKGAADFRSLKPNRASEAAEEYTNKIMSDPVLSRVNSVAHTFDFILGDKGGEMTDGDVVRASDMLDKHGISYMHDEIGGNFYVNADEANTFVNRYNQGGEMRAINGEGMVEVNDMLVQQMYNNSGISSIRDQTLRELQEENETNIGISQDIFKSNLKSERTKAESKAETKRQISDKQVHASAQRADLNSISRAEVIRDFEYELTPGTPDKLSDTPVVLAAIDLESERLAFNEQLKKTSTPELESRYERQFGKPLKEAMSLENDDEKEAKFATDWLREQQDFKVPQERIDHFWSRRVRSLKTKKGVGDFLAKMEAAFTPQPAAEQTTKSARDRIFGSGE